MNDNDQRGLQRLDIESKLPAGFDMLTEEEKRDLNKKLLDQDIAVRENMLRMAVKSKVAEHDLAVGIEAVHRLDHEKKMYTKRMKGETGSGTYDLTIRGGDTKFIIPILVAIGIIILGVVLIMALT